MYIGYYAVTYDNRDLRFVQLEMIRNGGKMLKTITETKERVALSIGEASDLSSLSKPFLRNEIKNGNLRVKRPGNSRRIIIMMCDFLDYLNGGNDDTK